MNYQEKIKYNKFQYGNSAKFYNFKYLLRVYAYCV